MSNSGTNANGTGLRVEPGTALPVPPPGMPPRMYLEPIDAIVAAATPFALRTGLGSGPLTYQWRRNGQPVAGATNASFSLTSPSPGDSGSYDVIVTGLAGAATSAVPHFSRRYK